jgi:PAS domain S-box-containing protein
MNTSDDRGPNKVAGFYSLPRCIESLALYLLHIGTLATASIWLLEPGLGALLLALALGTNVLIALRLRLVGALVTTGIGLILLVSYAFFSLGAFGSDLLGYPLSFVTGYLVLSGVLGVMTALVTGYHIQTAEICAREQSMLHKIFDALPVGIWVRSREGETVYLNDRWASFSKKTKEQILANPSASAPVNLGTLWERSALKVLDSEDGATRYQSVDLTDTSGRTSSLNLLTLRIYIDPLNDFGTLSLLVDETTLRAYENKIRTSENSLRLALDNAQMGFWDQALDTGIAYCDANWLKILGLPADTGSELLKLWQERIHPDDWERVDADYRQYFDSGEGSVRMDYRMLKGDSDYIWVQDYVGVVERNKDGSIKRIMGTMQDITERKQTEIDLNHAKEHAEAASEAKGHFIATISHEIRTPLNAIIGLSSFLAESEMSEDQLDLAETIHTSGRSLLVLVNDILDFSKIESGKLALEIQEYPLHLCFEECVKLFTLRASEQKVNLSLEMDESLPEFAIGDMERLRQIVQNLLSNALKFTETGSVTISVNAVELDALEAAYRPDPNDPVGYLDQADHQYLQVCVIDSGIGIPEASQDILFEAFSQVDASTTRKYGGTGLGLAICKRLVDAMGGRIWVKSEFGKGASFSFVVRTKFVEDAEVPVSMTNNPFEGVQRIAAEHPCDILIVGPKEETSRIIAACRQLGYAPHHCPDYDLSSGAFMRRRYNVIFIWMSDEVRALDLSRQLSRDSNIKKTASLIGCLPSGQAVSMERCKLSGFQGVINAPVRSDDLSEVILKALVAHD